jgi:hypothetical protein
MDEARRHIVMWESPLYRCELLIANADGTEDRYSLELLTAEAAPLLRQALLSPAEAPLLALYWQHEYDPDSDPAR